MWGKHSMKIVVLWAFLLPHDVSVFNKHIRKKSGFGLNYCRYNQIIRFFPLVSYGLELKKPKAFVQKGFSHIQRNRPWLFGLFLLEINTLNLIHNNKNPSQTYLQTAPVNSWSLQPSCLLQLLIQPASACPFTAAAARYWGRGIMPPALSKSRSMPKINPPSQRSVALLCCFLPLSISLHARLSRYLTQPLNGGPIIDDDDGSVDAHCLSPEAQRKYWHKKM